MKLSEKEILDLEQNGRLEIFLKDSVLSERENDVIDYFYNRKSRRAKIVTVHARSNGNTYVLKKLTEL